MSVTAEQLRVRLAAARSLPVHAFGDVMLEDAEHDRAEAIAKLEVQLAQRESEESGSWLGRSAAPGTPGLGRMQTAPRL